MSYLGKVFKHESDENFEEFAKSMSIPEEKAELMANFKPSLKLDKEGDTYTLSLIHPVVNREISFESGVEFEETIMDLITVSTIITVDGDVVTQVQKADDRTLTYVKEYSDDEMVETVTASFWDGTARRHYVAE